MVEQRALPMFNKVVLTRVERARLRRSMDNWLTIHAHIKRLEADDAPGVVLDELMRMLLIELHDHALRPRMHVITRLHGRITKWRKYLESREMRGWLEAQRKAASKAI